MTDRITRNAAKCLKCGDIIESRSVHDFRWCSCGALAVDGGRDYLKRCGDLSEGSYEDLSEYTEEPKPHTGMYGLLLDQTDEHQIVGGKLSR